MHIAILYGGRSSEHNVSVDSARNIYAILKENGYDVYPIGITLQGKFYLQPDRPIGKTIDETEGVSVIPGTGFVCNGQVLPVDVAFPVTHGTGGEDGNLQGLCFLAGIPVAGCDTLSSAVGMHKSTAQALFAQAGIPVVPTVTLDFADLEWFREREGARLPSFLGNHFFCSTCTNRMEIAFPVLTKRLGSSLLVKPEASGSSVGVSALPDATAEELYAAIWKAAKYSRQVMVQPLLSPAEEIECAVLAPVDGPLIVSNPGLVVDPARSESGFLTYGHKYAQTDGAHIEVPAPIAPSVRDRIRTYARQAFVTIRGTGYARVDFFHKDGELYLNEVNTLPGMTGTSHYPTLMAESGHPLGEVVCTLIEEAAARGAEERQREPLVPEVSP